MVNRKAWDRYLALLRKCDETALNLVAKWQEEHPGYASNPNSRRAFVEYCYAVATKYGEASAEMACVMYDALAEASRAGVAAAVPAETATFEQTGIVVNGARMQGEAKVPAAVARLVRQAGQDTMLQNAQRDGAEWAWVTTGDTCAFCITLASRGWQKQSKRGAKAHAEHIHGNCDCAYVVRFNPNDSGIAGYDPAVARDKYDNADGNTSQEKINAMRRESYARHKDEINAQKREAYARRKEDS